MPYGKSPAKMGHKDSAMKMGHEGSAMKNLNKGYGQQVKSPMKMQGSWMSKHVQNLFKEMPIDNKASALEMESPANKQGYNDRLDESLGTKDGKKSQSLKDRRDESKGMEKSKGKGAYSSDSQMS
jgi:hypothetical protein